LVDDVDAVASGGTGDELHAGFEKQPCAVEMADERVGPFHADRRRKAAVDPVVIRDALPVFGALVEVFVAEKIAAQFGEAFETVSARRDFLPLPIGAAGQSARVDAARALQ